MIKHNIYIGFPQAEKLDRVISALKELKAALDDLNQCDKETESNGSI